MRLSQLTALLTATLLAGCTALPAGLAAKPSAPVTPPPTAEPSAAAPQPTTQPTPQPTTQPTPQPAAAPKPPAVAALNPDRSLQELKAQLEVYLAAQQGTYGVYLIDIASGEGVGVNSDVVFPAASTFKLPMAMYVLDQVEQGQASLDEELVYSSQDDYEDGTGTLQDSIEDGATVPVRHLIELAITESDNIATNMLLRRFGRANIFAFMEHLGGKVTSYEDTWGTTPREMATYMRLARSNKAVTDPKLRKFLLDLLAHTAFRDRTAAGVPDGVTVAHKIGTLPGVVNDVALVYAPRRTFVVAVLSIDVEEEVASGVITEITRKVYAVERDLAAG